MFKDIKDGKMEVNKIYNMDVLEGLKNLEENSVDSIVSDPPYQLSAINGSEGEKTKGFLGKEWDILPKVDVLKECLRVLKPGSFALWLMTPRQDSQMEFILRLKEAGFVISFSPVYWTYGTGFPKSENISRAVDKKLGYQREVTAVDQNFGRAGLYGINETDKKISRRYTKPVSDEAKKLDGTYAGMSLKPAVEVIIVSMKPLSEKSYIEQAIKNGKGITHIDDCRIPYVSDNDFEKRKRGIAKYDAEARHIYDRSRNKKESFLFDTDAYHDKRGRFPANLLVSDGILDNGNITKSKQSVLGKGSNGGSGFFLTFKHEKGEISGYNDEGDFSRFFSLDAWWASRLKEFPKELRDTFPFLYIPKPSVSERDMGLEKLELKSKWVQDEDDIEYDNGLPGMYRNNIMAKNSHPTVKPISLMAYLIALTTFENEVVLDPYIGSGTTAVSAIIMNRKYIGFEREKEYFEIINAKIDFYNSKKGLFERVKIKEEIMPTKNNINSIGMFLESEEEN